uniref:Pre-mRNA-splicing factor 38B n=1 Tax=Piliocolobus tephrosceles TaxID=591936 RepID=A0A8C9GFE8_9PRIM
MFLYVNKINNVITYIYICVIGMANRTDASAIKLFGSNPQYLISNIIRSKIYECSYWKEKCFALTSESIIDQAVVLKYVGGTYGGSRKPTPFLCLVLKLLQIQPDKDIIYEYIKNEDFIYLRALGVFYLRLIGKSLEIYQNIEPILHDYRKIRMRLPDGSFQKIYMDVFVDNCLVLNNFLDVDFPTLTKRKILEDNNLLEKINLDYYKELLNISSSDEELLKNEKEQKKCNIPEYNTMEEGQLADRQKCRNNYNDKEETYEDKRGKKYKDGKGHKDKHVDKDRYTNRDRYADRDRYTDRDKHTDRDRKRKKDTHKSKKRMKTVTSEKKEKYKNKRKRYSGSDSSYLTNSESYERHKKERRDQKNDLKKKEDEYTSNDKNKEETSIERWNQLRKELGLKPLK